MNMNQWMHGAIALLLGARVCAQGAELANPPHDSYPSGISGFRDVPYQVLNGFHPQTADIYVPTGKGPFPAVVYVHGGGWGVGSPRMQDSVKLLTSLAARGYVVMGINYRFHGEARFPAQIQDAKAAIRWLRSNAEVYGADRARIGILGESAGGYLAALAGTSCGVAALDPPATPPARAGGPPGMTVVKTDDSQSDCVQAVVDWYGPIDFPAMDGQALPNSMKHDAATSAESKLLGCLLSQCAKELVAQTSPITYIDKTDPPFLIMHGDNDHSVPSGQSQEFHKALMARSVKATLVLVPGVDHGFAGASNAKLQEIWNTAFDFFDRTLAKPN
jgi:acetyl esterase/lipase